MIGISGVGGQELGTLNAFDPGMKNAMIKACAAPQPRLSRRRLLKWGAQIGGAAAVISLTPSKARAYGSWSSSGAGMGSDDGFGGYAGGSMDGAEGSGGSGGASSGMQGGYGMSDDFAEGMALARFSPRWSVREERELQMLRSSWQMPGGYGWRRKRALQNQRNRAMSLQYGGGMDGRGY